MNDLRDAINVCKANRPEGSRAPLHPNPFLRPLQPQHPLRNSVPTHSTAGATTTAADWLAKLEICEEELASFELALELYVKHLIRKALSGMIEPTLLRHVRNDKELIHLVIDHKQKWLPKGHEETQQEGFGKRGIYIFGGAATRWTGSEYEVLNIRVALDDSAQNW